MKPSSTRALAARSDRLCSGQPASGWGGSSGAGPTAGGIASRWRRAAGAGGVSRRGCTPIGVIGYRRVTIPAILPMSGPIGAACILTCWEHASKLAAAGMRMAAVLETAVRLWVEETIPGVATG